MSDCHICSLFSATAASLLQSWPTLCDPMDCSPPGSSVHGILQARTLEWVVMPSSRDLPNPGIKPGSSALQAHSLSLSHQGSPSLSSRKMLLTCSLSPAGGGEGPSFRNFYKNVNGFTFLPLISLI